MITQDDPARPLVWLPPSAVAAACAPSLLAFNVAPSATFLNQALAFLLWGLFATACGIECRLEPQERRRARLALLLPGLMLTLLVVAALGSHLAGTLPRSLTLSAIATLGAAAVLLVAGAQAGAGKSAIAQRALAWFAMGWLVAGLFSAAICVIQVMAPQWVDGLWIARSSLVGRGIGNLRQPNHVCTLLLWAAIAAVALQEMRWLRPRSTALVLTALAVGLVLTASRTAVLGVLLMAVWALIDRRLTRPGRRLLLAMPALYALCWTALKTWSHMTKTTLGVDERLAEADLSASRFGIWADCLELIRLHPWSGVGFGEFNFAWTLTVLPRRPAAFFDHAHNLFLHWAVELGLPLTVLLTVLLLAAVLRMLRSVLHAPRAAETPRILGGEGAGVEPTLATRVALALLALVLVHSQLEYPLWYAYFLLPTAWLVGFGLAQAEVLRQSPAIVTPDGPRKVRSRRRRLQTRAPLLALAGVLCAVGAVGAVVDYRHVAAVYDGQSEVPLQDRLKRSLRSPLFAHQAAYAAATVSREPAREMEALHQAAHNLLDARLIIAWAKAYAASGDLPRAQYLVARLRELRNPAAAEFLEPCARVGSAPGAANALPSAEPDAALDLPFQCRPADPRVVLRWTHFR